MRRDLASRRTLSGRSCAAGMPIQYERVPRTNDAQLRSSCDITDCRADRNVGALNAEKRYRAAMKHWDRAWAALLSQRSLRSRVRPIGSHRAMTLRALAKPHWLF